MSDHRTWSFRAGPWFGILGERATVVLPPSEKARVAALWELVDDGAGFDETLDALISSGLRDLPGFVLVSESGDETRVVLRGAAAAHFATADEVVHVEGDGGTTWVERTLTGVVRMRIEVADEESSDDLLVAGGLVRIATVEHPPAVVPPRSGADAEPTPEPTPTPEPDPEPPAEPPTEPVAVLDAEVAEVAEDADHDGETRTGSVERAEFVREQPGIPGQPLAPPVTARPVARLLISNGEAVEVDRVVLVGRAPEPRRHSLTEQPRLVRVPSPHQEISSTHLEVRPGSGADHGSAVVTDLGSTNGTLLVQPGLPPEDLKAGIAVQLIPGAVVDLGDGVTIQVENP
ncbi:MULTISPECIES: FHA domain-containing protein [unclassified Nocardioides]|uniref:FHA domain-containing protein n=1 Tax=unclassified Nocardioides TaxID=2615069 RepID=UPI0009F0EE12|nr:MULTISPECIES: FHA domain-containing protein [unclassified Nocardioides]GAW50726.1 forkhead-associated protein [Nocardioides sp. PD653-B2]GAW55465.1 forkhead-associated protein [Nocardioides sp. PD653]